MIKNKNNNNYSAEKRKTLAKALRDNIARRKQQLKTTYNADSSVNPSPANTINTANNLNSANPANTTNKSFH